MAVPPSSRAPLSRATGLLGAAGVLLIGTLAVTQPPPRAAPKTDASVAETSQKCKMHPDGFLRGRIFGALSLTANWSGPELSCDGMQRPDGKGVRLFFAGEQPAGGRVSFIIGIDGRLDELAGADRPANVTVIDEKQGQFYSTGGPGRCWVSISSVTPVQSTRSGTSETRIDGLVYCMGALPSLGDRSSLTLGDMRFAGRVSTDAG